METMCIIILVTPILLPIAQTLGMGVVHYGVSMLMALMVGSLTPPLSVNLFTSCRVLNVKYDEAFPVGYSDCDGLRPAHLCGAGNHGVSAGHLKVRRTIWIWTKRICWNVW